MYEIPIVNAVKLLKLKTKTIKKLLIPAKIHYNFLQLLSNYFHNHYITI